MPSTAFLCRLRGMRAESPRAAATKRASRIQEARARGEPVRQIVEREGVSARTVFNVQKANSAFFAVPSPSHAAVRDAKLRAVAAHLYRPAPSPVAGLWRA